MKVKILDYLKEQKVLSKNANGNYYDKDYKIVVIPFSESAHVHEFNSITNEKGKFVGDFQTKKELVEALKDHDIILE